MAFRYFLKRISDVLSLPVFGIFDANPAGIAMLLSYQFGSVRMAW
jgi:DNA topoisomerase VI subunit A